MRAASWSTSTIQMDTRWNYSSRQRVRHPSAALAASDCRNITMSGTFDLSGRVAVVTGGAQGLGAAIAQALAEHGADLAVLDVQADAVLAFASRLGQDTGRATLGLGCDVRDAAQVASCVEQIVARFGRIDVLVN